MKERIFELLKQNQISQYKLAKDLGVSAGNVTDWKNGRCTPTTEVLIKIADYFNVSLDYLLGLTEVSTPVNELLKLIDPYILVRKEQIGEQSVAARFENNPQPIEELLDKETKD